MKRGREGRVEGGGDERENGKSGWREDEGWKRGLGERRWRRK